MKPFHLFSLFVLSLIHTEVTAWRLRWGVLSAGRISNDFILSFNNFDKRDHEIVAIASRNCTRGKEYATRFGIPVVYDNYTDLGLDPNVDVVYIGVINPYHFAAVKLMLELKKHVLCEKPMVVHPEDARELFRIAKENNVVLMEALWTRFLPSYIQATAMLNQGAIGQIEHISTRQLISENTEKTYSNKNLARGVSLDIGIYSLNAILLAVNFTRPVEFKVVGRKFGENTMDCTVTGIMKFACGTTASFVMTTVVAQSVDERLSSASYAGTKGYIRLPYPMNGPDYIEINGRFINARVSDNQSGYNWPTNAGLRFQANEIKRLIAENRLTSDVMPPEHTYLFADLLHEIYVQLGINLPPTIRNYDFIRL